MLILCTQRSVSGSFAPQLVSSTVFARRFRFYAVICVLFVCATIIPSVDW